MREQEEISVRWEYLMAKKKKRLKFKGYKAPKGGRLEGDIGTILDVKKEELYGFLGDEQGIKSESGKVMSESKQVIKKYNGHFNNQMIRLRSEVILKELGNEQLSTYEVVPSHEVDIFNNKISEESNLGKLLLGKKVGQVIKLPTPMGIVGYQILEIKIGRASCRERV